MRIIWRNVKYPRIDLRDGEITIIAPRGTDIEKIISQKRGWIEKNMKKIEMLIARAEEDIRNNGIRILDRYYILKHDCKNAGLMGDKIHVCRKKGAYVKNQLKKLLRDDLIRRVEKFSSHLNVTPKKIFIREQNTKWGSCSSPRNLSFNLSLVFLPSEFRDYVVAHEVVHLLHPNHGYKFKDTLKNLGISAPSKDDLLYYWYYSRACRNKLYLNK